MLVFRLLLPDVCLPDLLWSAQTRSTSYVYWEKPSLDIPKAGEGLTGVLHLYSWELWLLLCCRLWARVWTGCSVLNLHVRVQLSWDTGNCCLQANIKNCGSVAISMLCLHSKGHELPQPFPGAHLDPKLATSWHRVFSRGLISLIWDLTWQLCQGSFPSFWSSFWAGRRSCTEVWS